MSDMELAASLFGSRPIESGRASTTTSTAYGTAVGDSKDGYVDVVIDGETTATGADGSDGTNVLTLPTSPSVKEGDTVLITLVGGTSKTPTVTAVVGSGDRTAASTVVSSTQEYAVGSSATKAPTTGWSTDEPKRTAGAYIWMRTVTVRGDGNTEVSAAACVTGNDGAQGDKGDKGDAGKGISSATVQYASSTSGTTAPTSGWQTSIPTVAEGSYLWTKTTTTYTSGNPTTSYSVAYIAKNGTDGASVSAVKIQYYSHTSSTEAPSSTADWQDSVPDWESGKYIWQRTQTTIGGKTVTGNPVLYGSFNSLATSVEGNTSKISQTASALGLTFGTSKATGTLIKADSTGIEVGRSTDGSNFASTHTKMGTSAFSIHAKDHTELATFGADTVELGKNSSSAVIKLCNDKVRVTSETSTYEGTSFTTGYIESGGADAIGISADQADSGYPIRRANATASVDPTMGSYPRFDANVTYNHNGSTAAYVNYATADMVADKTSATAYLTASNGACSGHVPYLGLKATSGSSVVTLNGGTLSVNGKTGTVANLADAVRPTTWKFSREAIGGSSNVTGVAGWTDLNGIFSNNQMGYSSAEWFTVGGKSNDNSFTVVKPGVYRIKLQVFGEGASERIGAGVYVGTTEASSTFYYCNGATIAAIAEHVGNLTAGTNVYLKGWGNNAGWKWRCGGQYTYAAIDYLGAI